MKLSSIFQTPTQKPLHTSLSKRGGSTEEALSQQNLLASLPMVSPPEGCLKGMLVMVWVTSILCMPVPTNRRTNPRGIGYPTRDSNHNGSGQTVPSQATTLPSKLLYFYLSCQWFIIFRFSRSPLHLKSLYKHRWVEVAHGKPNQSHWKLTNPHDILRQ